MENPQVLVQQEPRLTKKEAEKYLYDLLLKLNIKLPNDKSKQYILKDGKTKIHCKDLIDQLINKGICDIQIDLDRSDAIFGGAFSIAVSSNSMTITSEWAGFKKVYPGPSRDNSSELELSEDIEFYKNETCYESNDYNFELCARNYRAYLFSSIALIDAYINRHIHYYNFLGLKTENFLKLKKSKKAEQRVEFFINEFCIFEYKQFINSKEWNDFIKLKELRNEIVHSLTPYMGISLRYLGDNLNLSINGVGGFLKKLQEGQGRLSLGFIEKVRTSPIIHFNQITRSVDGKIHEKKIFNKLSR